MLDKRTEDRIKGCIFGQAIGDALGLGTEFMSEREVHSHYPEGLTCYDQIVQDAHRRRWAKGAWTDDTDMMLCIADAIVADRGKVDYLHIARNFKTWAEGKPMGIGRNTFKVLSLRDYLEDPMRAAQLVWLSSRGQSAANGALMRTSILGIVGDPVKDAENVCKLTHADPRCVGSCVICSSAIHQLIFEDRYMPDIESICKLGDAYSKEIRSYLGYELLSASDPSYRYDLSRLNPASQDDMGYTLKTLSVAIWALFHAQSFEDGLLAVVNAGGDADTNAAVACSILGAKFGYDSISSRYIEGLIGKSRLEKLSEDIINILTIQDR